MSSFRRFRRRGFLTGLTGGLGALALERSGSAQTAGPERSPARRGKPTGAALDREAARPVLRLDGLTSPVVIDSVRLLKKDTEYFVHVRSKDGAEGISVINPPRADHFDKIFKDLVAPFFLGKDARDLENLLWELYRWRSNYKLYGLALWCPQAWIEFALLDLMGRVAKKPLWALLGERVREDVAFYVASGKRDTTPEQEVEGLQALLQRSGARAVKFRVGGRMNRNVDAMPGRSEKLITLARKTLGDKIDLHADANSSYDAEQGVRIGRLLEEVGAVYFEEPCEFDHLEETKVVADRLKLPVAGGEQEYSHWRFRWMILNRGVDIVQPDLYYYGGMVRSMRVARMAQLANMSTTTHLSSGFGFIYMLHFAQVVPDIGRYQEYKVGTEKYNDWFAAPVQAKDGKMRLPPGPGVGIPDIKAVLKGAVEV
jgi:L-alanine-DL-glutamate epimerase-like enolase superfamily enzyme